MENTKSTRQMFEDFYGKDFSEISQSDLGSANLVDFGCDVGNEIWEQKEKASD